MGTRTEPSNRIQQVGGAPALVAVSAIAISRTDDLLTAGTDAPVALTGASWPRSPPRASPPRSRR